jgi:hypothetical protein
LAVTAIGTVVHWVPEDCTDRPWVLTPEALVDGVQAVQMQCEGHRPPDLMVTAKLRLRGNLAGLTDALAGAFTMLRDIEQAVLSTRGAVGPT